LRVGIAYTLTTAVALVCTKLIIRRATILRRPLHFRNAGRLVGANQMIAGPNLILDVLAPDAVLTIGDRLVVNHAVHIGCMQSVTIGNDVLMASGVYVSDHSHGSYTGDNQSPPTMPPNKRPIVCKPVVIGDNCWLGERVCVLPGVTIGSGTIVGANAVVTNDLPENCIAVGIPAKVIKVWDAASSTWASVQKPARNSSE
jgi:acetyltransferase-like isoleucine patch superfamily enzyme